MIAGVDEAGVGCLAGPCYIAAVVMEEGTVFPLDVRDSKDCTDIRLAREAVVAQAQEIVLQRVDVFDINTMGIWKAWDRGMARVLSHLRGNSEITEVTVDGIRAVAGHDWVTYQAKADRDIQVVGAASIIAKGAQLDFCDKMEFICPGWGFAEHHGYGTKKHMIGLEKMGVSPFHRTSYKPIQKILEEQRESQGQDPYHRFRDDAAHHLRSRKGALARAANSRFGTARQRR